MSWISKRLERSLVNAVKTDRVRGWMLTGRTFEERSPKEAKLGMPPRVIKVATYVNPGKYTPAICRARGCR